MVVVEERTGWVFDGENGSILQDDTAEAKQEVEKFGERRIVAMFPMALSAVFKGCCFVLDPGENCFQ